MPSTPVKPWWRADRNAWYVCYKGKQVRLAKGKNSRAEANRALARLLLEPKPRTVGQKPTLEEALGLWLERSKSINDLSTYRRHKWTANSFLAHMGGPIPVEEVTENHVASWANNHEWSKGTKCTNLAVIKSAFSYAERQRYIRSNPCDGISFGSAPARALMMSHEQSRAVLAATAEQPWIRLGQLIRVMHATGMRPSEAMRLEAAFFNSDYSAAELVKHKRRRHSVNKRVVRFPASVRQLVISLCEEWPDGAILRSTRGRPWTHAGADTAMRRLRKKLGFGPECVLESFRHEFITDALEKGVPAATVAELCGTSVAMIARHYSKIGQREDHLDASVSSVR